MLKNVIFDFGNVLVRWEPYNALSDFFPSKSDMLAKFEEIEFFAWNTEQDRGRSWAEGFMWVADNHPNDADIFDAYYAKLQDAHRDPVEGMPNLVNELINSGVNVLGLTNAAEESFQAARTTVPQVDRMTDVLVSAREGLIKPSPEIFELCISRNELTASETLFVDDNKGNCEGAMAVGLKAHHFQNASTLTAQLIKEGLLTLA
ncbi:MAG: HAD-IA family hydrolase [Boseongicola sp.]|nr:MAG: HAD-IA family hydrolase [Boseongicola sp.]